MGVYQAVVTTNGSGDGTNLDSLGNPLWSGHFRGELMGIRIEFGASPAAGTDTTLSEITGLKRTLHTFTDTAAAANAFPAAAIAGAIDAFLPHYVDSSNLKVTVAQGGDTKTVYLTALVKEC